jgi:vacuolar-type H+-ATPase subunit E/Vma4
MNGDNASVSRRDRLIESLWQDARREADQYIARAQAEVRKLLEDSVSFRETEMARSTENARIRATPQVAMILNQARNRTRLLLLEGCYSFLNSCFDDAMESVTGKNGLDKRVRSSFPALLAQALSVLENQGSMEITMNPADMEKARSILDGKGTSFNLVADEATLGGVRLKGDSGSFVVDSTLEARMSALRTTPPLDILKMVRPGEDP